jgi:chorismate synthase
MMALVDGFPAGLTIDTDLIDAELQRRQKGYGRGGRQNIETDTVEILSGTWRGTTIGSPIALWVKNRDFKIEKMPDLESFRPGHGDLSGSRKYGTGIRQILERSSARETAARVATGALNKQLLHHFGIDVASYVVQIGPLELPPPDPFPEDIRSRRDQSELNTLVPERDDEAKAMIDQCGERGDTVGGIVEIRVTGVPFGLGTHAMWDRKLDGRLAQAIMAVQAIKGVEVGIGFEAGRRFGSQVHDPIEYDPELRETNQLGFQRPSNNAGGLEAGMSNSQPIILRAAKKPISTLKNGLPSINIHSKEPATASYERSDVCAIAACSVVLENVVATEISTALTDKFGGDQLQEMLRRFELFHQMAG